MVVVHITVETAISHQLKIIMIIRTGLQQPTIELIFGQSMSNAALTQLKMVIVLSLIGLIIHKQCTQLALFLELKLLSPHRPYSTLSQHIFQPLS